MGSRSATLTSGRTCTPTPSCPEAPPCTLVLLTACGRRSPPLPPPPSRSRSLLPPRGSTPSGSEAPSWLPSLPSSRCGSPSRSTTSAAPPCPPQVLLSICLGLWKKNNILDPITNIFIYLPLGFSPLFYPTIFPLPVVWTSFHSIRLSITFLLQF